MENQKFTVRELRNGKELRALLSRDNPCIWIMSLEFLKTSKNLKWLSKNFIAWHTNTDSIAQEYDLPYDDKNYTCFIIEQKYMCEELKLSISYMPDETFMYFDKYLKDRRNGMTYERELDYFSKKYQNLDYQINNSSKNELTLADLF